MFFLIAALFFLILFSVSIGYIKISWSLVFKILFGKIFHQKEFLNSVQKTYLYVVWDVRLPRILTSVLVGIGLSVAGVVFQGILLNPLADPYTLGVSAGAAFGASIAIVLNIFGASYSVPFFAFIGAILTLGVVIGLSISEGSISSTNLILAGVIVTAILSAGISFMKFVADEHVSVIIFWLMGSLASKSWSDVFLLGMVVSVGVLVCLFFTKELNLLSLGDKAATSLGVNTNFVRFFLLTIASLISSTCVSITGIIGFVGLIVPHMVRFLVGSDNVRLLPIAGILGGILLLGADTLTRTILPTELPIGVLTALIGGPVFCFIFKKTHKSVFGNE